MLIGAIATSDDTSMPLFQEDLELSLSHWRQTLGRYGIESLIG